MKAALVAVAMVAAPVITWGQEARFNFDGIFDLGSTNSRTETRYYSNPAAAATESTELNWGFDFNIRTYVLDPRFISLTFEPTMHRGTGHTDALGNSDSDTGGSFYLDFLKTGYYPFRFYYINHSLNYQQEHLNSANTKRHSVGFDWTLRKPKLPPVFISYDTSRFDYEFSLTPVTVTRATNFLATTQGTYGAWTTNVAYSRQASTQAFTGVGTSTDLLRGSVSRPLWANSQVLTNAIFEHLSLNDPAGGRMDLPFFSLHTDLRTRHTAKLSSLFSHQYYRTGAETPTAPSAARFEFGTTAFNDIRSQVSYQVSSSLSVRASSDAAFISTPAIKETVARNASFSGGLNWQRKLAFLQTRAGVEQGVAYAASKAGDTRTIPFWSANAGLSVGDPRVLLFAADGSYSHRPDLFEIGGFYTQWGLTGSLDSQALHGFRMRGSAGYNEIAFLTQVGYERFHTTVYSASITRSIFSLALARSADISLRNLLLESVISPGQLFITLPVETLLHAPFSGGNGVYTTGAFNVRPAQRFEFDARYLRQRNLFTNGPNILLRQYEIFGTYHLGKFLLSAGLLYLGDATDDELHHLRRYYFFRVTRPFHIM